MTSFLVLNFYLESMVRIRVDYTTIKLTPMSDCVNKVDLVCFRSDLFCLVCLPKLLLSQNYDIFRFLDNFSLR